MLTRHLGANVAKLVFPLVLHRHVWLVAERNFFVGLDEVQHRRIRHALKAGYDAIEFIRHGTKVDAEGNPVEGSGFLAPIVRADKCVGCGLCQTRCYAINVAQKKLIDESAIIIEAGEGKEDRLMRGSYVALRVKDRLP